MRYFWTFFWIFLLVNMMFYVVGAMSGAAYDFAQASIISLIFSLLIFFLGDALVPNTPAKKHH